MSLPDVDVVATGLANVASVRAAFTRLGVRTRLVSDAHAPDGIEAGPPPRDVEPRVGIIRRSFRFLRWSVRGCFCIASLVALLAVLTAIPILQLIAFGYLLQVAGGLANGAKLGNSLPHLHRAGQIGLAATAIFFAALPTQLLAHWESVAYLINPDLFSGKACRVDVETDSELTVGQTIVDWWGVTGAEPNAMVMSDVNRRGFIDLVVERIARL